MREIIELNPSDYPEAYDFRYSTSQYMDISISKSNDAQSFVFTIKNFDVPVEKSFSASFGASFLENPVLFGIIQNDEPCAFLEVSFESWTNRMRVANILVLPPFRGKRLGEKLMQHAIMFACEKKVRALVLETQSCNVPAIMLYQKSGLSIIGFDLLHYSNDDIEQKEFRIEMGLTF